MIERGSLPVVIVADIERSHSNVVNLEIHKLPHSQNRRAVLDMRTFLLYVGVVLFAGAMWLGLLEILKVVVVWTG